MILFYAAEKNPAVDALDTVIRDHLPTHQRIFFTEIDLFERRLRRPHQNLDMVLISVRDAIEMSRLTALRSLLLDLRLILVLPTRDQLTVAWAHTLAPRFVACADHGVTPAVAVLENMLAKLAVYESES